MRIMNQDPFSCACPCTCNILKNSIQMIVLTGGPGAGKTAVLEYVRKIFCQHVAILPEAASILFSGGFIRSDSPLAKKAAQRSIYFIQQEIQNLVIAENKWILGLCDRGTIDGLAYWPGSNEEFFKSLNHTSLLQEYAKYTAVIHLRSPSLENGYNHQNPVRIESADLAADIDKRIHEVWKQHHNYIVIDSSANFLDKVTEAVHRLKSFLPLCCQKQLEHEPM